MNLDVVMVRLEVEKMELGALRSLMNVRAAEVKEKWRGWHSWVMWLRGPGV